MENLFLLPVLFGFLHIIKYIVKLFYHFSHHTITYIYHNVSGWM